MNPFHLPPNILLAIFTHSAFSIATAIPSPTKPASLNGANPVPANGTGSEYANACWTERMSFDSALSSWSSKYAYVKPTTMKLGGTSFSEVTYYENATTLCDGRARVTYSPAISLSTGTITIALPVTGTTTILNTNLPNFTLSIPTCSIQPKDCDGLWSQYSDSTAAASTITPAPFLEAPTCFGVSAAASWASVTSEIYGCGKCTIYGEGVQLVFFPTTASRDFCASTPTASLTHYGPGAVITAFSGKNFTGEGDVDGGETVMVNGHTFTSGTAYISIATVSAVDRCSKTFGTPVKDAILAMPSESVLSLRYSQDHFQRVMETDQITGYPVSYADFNSPIPWSAWNGQNICGAGGYGGRDCSIIYENSFRPQLAIPPQITELSPDFKDCQIWYNGLWDPPLALHTAASVAKPTLPGLYEATSVTASAVPSSTPTSPAAPPTALPDELPTMTSQVAPSSPPTRTVGPTFSIAPVMNSNPCDPYSESWVKSFDIDGHVFWATDGEQEVKIDSNFACIPGGPVQTLENGVQVSYANDGLLLKGVSTIELDTPATPAASGPTEQDTNISTGDNTGCHVTPPPSSATAGPETALIEIDGETQQAVQASEDCPIIIASSLTLTPGGSPMTFSKGEVVSAASDKILVEWSSTLGVDLPVASSNGNEESGDLGDSTSQVRTSLASHSTGSSTSITGLSFGFSNTETGQMVTATGSASNMSSSQALSLFAAVVALVCAVGA